MVELAELKESPGARLERSKWAIWDRWHLGRQDGAVAGAEPRPKGNSGSAGIFIVIGLGYLGRVLCRVPDQFPLKKAARISGACSLRILGVFGV